MKAKGNRCAVPAYESYRIKELVWELREVITVPAGFKRGVVRSPEELWHDYRWLFDTSPVEKLVVFVLNAINKCVAVDVVTTGLVNSSLAHPREVFRSAIACCGAAVIIAHNHPSGNPEPSQEDIVITKQMIEAGKILGIAVHDHVVFGENCYVSMTERRLL
jgi:DNA repair protein RadC